MKVKWERAAVVVAAAQLADDKAEFTDEVLAKIQDDVTVLADVTGTLAPASITLDHLGGIADDSTVLSGCNIGTVMPTDCYGVAVASSLDLSDNRMAAGVTATSGVRFLIEQIYAAIRTGASGATLTLDVSGNAVPDNISLARVRQLVSDGCTITVETPSALAVTGGTPSMAGTYTWDDIHAYWICGPDNLYWTGTAWRVEDRDNKFWEASSVLGVYVANGGSGAAGIVTVAAA